jgi:predicted transcriptional regulator
LEKTINFRIAEELKVELQFIAEEREIKVSSLVREIITDFIENYYKEEEPIISYPKKVKEFILEIPANYNYNK